ncbi:coiled-coil domain-containing protein lobo-like [Thrips palmi]|uniref:Coiled-coil domain-containing protein lobo-like n=1 Tax=Thrips palmi TaxID=161013 RepID=A0A6P8ZHE7_THRPL|nr:coiled-coil domain-containing protein lobo-like [Thrips palmi]XP_034231726.1 coiled-coil domain-containing protein lobo-like [Thrips palmi]
MEESESLLVTERDSFQERGKGFHGEEGDATSFASFRGSTSSRKKGSTLSSSTSSHVETLSCITPQRLKEIAIELGIIKLCWPQNNNLHQERKYYPASFSENTNKEKLLMWYAENFRQQFHHEFPHRRPLLLAVENECGLQASVQ